MKKRLNLVSRAVNAKQEGQVAVISVLILFAVGTIVMVTGVLITLDTAKNTAIEKESSRAFYLADGCIEEGLYRYKQDETYAGSNLNVDDGSCIITVTGEGEPKTITAQANVGDQTRKLQVGVSRNPFTVETWEEIP